MLSSLILSNDRTNNLLTFVKVGSIKWFKLLLLFWIVTCHLYLFHLIVFLNPDFNFSKSFISFSFDKVTTGAYNFVSYIWNSNPVRGLFATVISAKTQVLADMIVANN